MALVSYQMIWFLNKLKIILYDEKTKKNKYQLLFLEILFHKYVLKLKKLYFD